MEIKDNIWKNAYSNDEEKFEHFKKQLQKINESRVWILGKIKTLKKIKNVLEVACGPGIDIEYLEREYEGKIPFSYTGLDYTPKFIETLKVQYPQHEFIEADAMDIPFEDESFDVVYTRHSLEHVSNPHAELDEMFRLAKKYIIIGWFRLVDTKTSYHIKSNKFGEYPLHDLNRTEFEAKVSEWGVIEDTFTINNHECWMVKKHPKKKRKK